MQNVSRLFGEKDTNSFNDHFRSSLWRLVILYTTVLAAILLISSGVIYSAFSQKLERRYRDFHVIPIGGPGFAILQPPPMPPTREEVQAELVYTLFLVNGILLIVAGFSSYWLAHYTLRPLKDAYENQRRFLADASHELRTPLSILKIELENEIANTTTSPENRAKAQGHLEEVDRMSALVSDLLTLSRLHDEGTVRSSEHKTINISAIVRENYERLQPLAKEHNVTIVLQEEKNDITLLSDEKMVASAVVNVIKNAILYNKPQGTVTVSVAGDSNIARIEVADTGIGVAPEDLKNIFKRFFRSDKSRSRKTGGTGLGLPIVQTSIEQLGGTVYIKSTPGQGTIVTLELPLSTI